MPQFDVYRNGNPTSRGSYPLLVDLQADLLSQLATRVVAPLATLKSGQRGPLGTLTPVLSVNGKQYAMLTPQLAGIACKELDSLVASVSNQRDEIVAALDLLITGV